MTMGCETFSTSRITEAYRCNHLVLVSTGTSGTRHGIVDKIDRTSETIILG
jgi:hypothetical protein